MWADGNLRICLFSAQAHIYVHIGEWSVSFADRAALFWSLCILNHLHLCNKPINDS